MQWLDGRPIYAASDLNDYVECRRLSDLDALVAVGKLTRPDSNDAQAELLRRKGDDHERAYLERMRELYPGDVREFPRSESGIEAYVRADRQTLDAMRHGPQIIYQATFFDGTFLGHADFLRRVPIPSQLGNYSYEVIDTKLGVSPKPYYLVQLCNYSEHLERLQGVMPKFGHVVFGNGAEGAFRLHDYIAYYRHLKAGFLAFAGDAELDRLERPREYPLECKHCAICPWDDQCESRRRADDHLSLVARIRRDQIAKLEAAGVARVSELAQAADDRRPSGMAPATFTKLRRQAALQVRGRASGHPIYELLEHAPPLGFALLPAPAKGDVFFDMEGDPLYEPGRGLEYLFGCWLPDDGLEFRAFWGVDRDHEKRAFEAFIDFVTERRRQYPALHVYHYANYEKDALRRLAQRHATREDEVDDLLRDEVLVDLFAVVRQALAISEESYGLKNVERFYDLARETAVKKGNESIVMFERWLFDGDRQLLEDIERYNYDDCRSTHKLRDWLLQRRDEAVATFGLDLPFRDGKAAKESAPDGDAARRSELEHELLANVDAPQTERQYAEMPARRRLRYLLGNLMAYHRREEKPGWWAYFDRCDNLDRLTEFDKEAIGGMTLREEAPPRRDKRSFIYTYEFPDQPYKLGSGDSGVDPRTKLHGTILSLDADANRLELRTTAQIDAARAITELIPRPPLSTAVQRAALARIGEAFVAGRLETEYPATYDLLASRDPRVAGMSLLQPHHVDAGSVGAVAAALDRSYLFLQGPPGSGKSTIGSRVICDLLEGGKRVAVTSMSHKANHNLLRKVEECMASRGRGFRGLYKHSGAGSEYRSPLDLPLVESTDSKDPFCGSGYQLAGGTGWLCAREELDRKFDYLFIDEAGQVALADALANSLCARNIVLLGDPSQLAQVSQGRHPLHAGDSVLQHLLGDDQTVPPHRGIFLDVSYRMQPEICAFISDAMYENRLNAADATRLHRVTTKSDDYAGLYFAAVEHAGNSSSSNEEANEIVRRILLLIDEGIVTDSQPPRNAGVPRRLTVRDVVVVTPYNAQRRLITNILRDAGVDVDAHTGVQVGTVDKFQGQEAAVVFYSMATSSGADVPRNVEFLFEPNRFNVAISRARAATVLVCSPRLLDIRCRTPEQMALANLLCAFAQRAKRSARVGLAV
ncbi:MAG: TM0106 family RecB-like putative nuclease [Candidatus Eremiobacteraeota bacterium]|nr:TM0106 family RecB-like putative nuclease [Candidatus Eremiobacteraeota bacterium]